MREMAKLFAITAFLLLLAFPVVAEENKNHKNDLKIPPKSIEKYHEKITIIEKNVGEQADKNFKILEEKINLKLSILKNEINLLSSKKTDTIPLWATAIASLIVALVALFQGVIKSWYNRPRLSAEFKKMAPWVHDILLKSNGNANIIRNYRLKIINGGRRSAKKAETRIEKIICNKNKIDWYHPTALKWSGEDTYDPVAIPPGSHFFLDVFRINNINVPNSTWSLWVDAPQNRGLPPLYPSKGDYEIHLFCSEETTKPNKCIIRLIWDGHSPTMPDVRVKWENNWLPSSEYEDFIKSKKTNITNTSTSTNTTPSSGSSTTNIDDNSVTATTVPNTSSK